MTVDKLIAEMDKALQFPGVSNAWTMPIKARIDMLSTGIRTPVGVKVLGTDLAEMEKLARQIEAVIRTVPGTTSAYAERVIGGYYLNIDPDRAQLARYGLMVGDLQNMIAMALGAEPVTTTVEGPRALHRQHPLSARLPQRSAGDRDAGADPDGRRRHGAARPGGQGEPGARAGQHPHRELPSLRRTSSSICATATSAATSPTRRRRSPPRSSFRPATTSPGAASSNIWSAPRPGCKSSCRSRC